MRSLLIVLFDGVQSLDLTGSLTLQADGKYVTAAGVSAGIDMALALTGGSGGGRVKHAPVRAN